MESFISKLKDNIHDGSEVSYKKSSRIREFLSNIVTSSLEVKKIDEVSDNGDVVFEISGKEIGLPYSVLKEYQVEIFSNFIANFMGELIVRENINEFSRLLTEIDEDIYRDTVDKFDHQGFGLRVIRDKLLFKFHISLLREILTEDLERKIR